MDNLIGKKLDGLYEVRELIGSGGMANVYKAVMLGHNGPVPAGTDCGGRQGAAAGVYARPGPCAPL